jgi:thiamine pyrophosphate-dependent acetolactate synthase large subunit-like protein
VIPRHRAIAHIAAVIGHDDLVVSTTGMISRELFATGDRPTNFYMLGSMGLLASFGLGLAVLLPERRVFVVEGDGSALMSLGTFPLIAAEAPDNLVHIVLDNEAYESTGAQPSITTRVDLAAIAVAAGYRTVSRPADTTALEQALGDAHRKRGPHFALVKVGIAPVPGLPRVSRPVTEIRDGFRSAIGR